MPSDPRSATCRQWLVSVAVCVLLSRWTANSEWVEAQPGGRADADTEAMVEGSVSSLCSHHHLPAYGLHGRNDSLLLLPRHTSLSTCESGNRRCAAMPGSAAVNREAMRRGMDPVGRGQSPETTANTRSMLWMPLPRHRFILAEPSWRVICTVPLPATVPCHAALRTL